MAGAATPNVLLDCLQQPKWFAGMRSIQSASDRNSKLLLMLAVFVSVLAARLLVVSLFASPLPFADEWDAGAAGLYKPYVTGNLSLANLLAPHNEHRFLTSRLLGLAEFELAGGWNVRFQMVVNAVLAAGLAARLLGILAPLVQVPRRLALATVTALTFALPIDLETSLMGMNAHFYLMILFSLAALLALIEAPVLGLKWWLGVLWSGLAYLSVASAALTPLAAVAVMLLQIASGVRRLTWHQAASVLLLIAVTATMLFFVPSVAESVRFHAHSISEFVDALVAIAALPLITPLGLAVVQAPIVVHVWNTISQRRAASDPAWIAVAIAGWIAAQMVSIAYNRALSPLSSRYLDIALLALPVSAAILLGVGDVRRLLRAASAAWMFTICTVLTVETGFSSTRGMQWNLASLEQQRAIVTEFLATKDPAQILAGKATLSYPNPQRLIEVLSDPVVQSLIPDEVQPAAPPAHLLDRGRLMLKGGFKQQIDGLVAILSGVAILLLGLAVGLWFVAGYQNATKRGGVEGDVSARQ